jgi:hypothetical protein
MDFETLLAEYLAEERALRGTRRAAPAQRRVAQRLVRVVTQADRDAKKQQAREERRARWEARSPEERDAERTERRERKHGFSRAIIACLRELQRGQCAICAITMAVQRDPEHRLSAEQADHCHATLRPRGLLCMACNMALGLYQNSQRAAGLRVAAYERYLENPPVNLI